MLRYFSVFLCVFKTVFGHFDSACLQYNLVEGLPNLYLSPMSEKIGHTWVDGGVWDKPLIQKFYSLLSLHDPSFVAIDVGAQTGSFSLLAKYFPKSRWFSFEPLKEACEALKNNLLLNDIQNVSVYPIALSNTSGQCILQLPAMNAWGLSTLGEQVLRFVPIEQRSVECIDLDRFAFLHKIEKVDFIKIDVEGWEFYVLQGAKDLIERDHPIILMEYNETNMKQCGVSRSWIDGFLAELGYEWKLVSSEDVLCMPKTLD